MRSSGKRFGNWRRISSRYRALPDAREPVFRVNNDMALSAFFQSMLVYFAGDEEPPEALLKLKLKELLTSILMSPGNPT